MFYEDYLKNKEVLSRRLHVSENFDIIERNIDVGRSRVTFYFVDGFIKDNIIQRIMQEFLGMKSLGTAEETLHKLPYIEVDLTDSIDTAINSVLAGQALFISDSFGNKGLLVDARTYPARSTAEPDSDRVMQGSHDGFVETLIMNTALIRRRIRDEKLTMRHYSIGSSSKTDVVLCYVKGAADERLLKKIEEKLERAKPKSLTLGFQSLAETLIQKGWLNPFPKIRTTERPDTAAAQLLEGTILVLCDTSPQVMLLPTSIFQYFEETDDYYFPPLTGSYLRLVRVAILVLSAFATPLWYLYLQYSEILPDSLSFLIPDTPGALPIIVQLLLVEIAIDGLKIASMNTPDMLSNSLSIVGALILGDFAVEVGWLSPDVILYMAFVAIATFAQQNHELGYALKFVRVITLVLVFFLKIWGMVSGVLLLSLLVATNSTVTGRHYLYPLFPFNPKAFKRLLIRERKKDFNE